MLENSVYQSELKNIAKNASYSGFGIIFMNLMSYVNSVIVTRNIGASYYGLFALASSIISLVASFSLMGLSIGTLRYVSHYLGKKDYSRIKGTIIVSLFWVGIISICFLFLTYLLSPVLSTKLFHKVELTNPLRLLIFSLPFFTIVSILLSSLRGLNLLKYWVTVRNILTPSIRFVLLCFFFLMGMNFLGVLITQVALAIVLFFIALYFFYKHYWFGQRSIKPTLESRKILKFSFPLYLESFINNGIGAFPIYIMGIYLASKEIGIYNITVKLSLMVTLSLTAFNLIFAPTISHLYASGKKDVLAHLFKTVTKWIFTISLAAFCILLLFNQQILGVFGKEFESGAPILFLVILGELLNTGVGSAGYILIMTGRPKIALFNSILMLILTTALCFLLIPKYGAIGAGIARASSIGIINILRLVEVYYYEKIHPYNLKFLKPVLSGALSFIIVFFIKNIIHINQYVNLITGLVIFGVTYILFLLLLKLEDEDKYVLSLVFNKFHK